MVATEKCNPTVSLSLYVCLYDNNNRDLCGNRPITCLLFHFQTVWFALKLAELKATLISPIYTQLWLFFVWRFQSLHSIASHHAVDLICLVAMVIAKSSDSVRVLRKGICSFSGSFVFFFLCVLCYWCFAFYLLNMKSKHCNGLYVKVNRVVARPTVFHYDASDFDLCQKHVQVCYDNYILDPESLSSFLYRSSVFYPKYARISNKMVTSICM